MLSRGEAKWKGGNIKRAGVARTRKRRRGIRKERGIEAGGRASGRVVGRGTDWGRATSRPHHHPPIDLADSGSCTATTLLFHHARRPPPATTHPNLSMRLISHISLWPHESLGVMHNDHSHAVMSFRDTPDLFCGLGVKKIIIPNLVKNVYQKIVKLQE